MATTTALLFLALAASTQILSFPVADPEGEEASSSEIPMCGVLEVLNATSCLLPGLDDNNVYCTDESTDFCQCPSGSICNHMGADKCTFVCLKDKALDSDNQNFFNELSIKGLGRGY